MANNGWTNKNSGRNGAYAVYVPTSGVTKNTQIFVFSCNPHNYNLEWLEYVKKKQREHPENIYMVIPSIQDSDTSTAQQYTNDLIKIMNKYDIPSTNINMFSWSNGNKGSSALATSLNGKGYTIGKFVNVFGNFDGSHSNGFFSSFKTGTSSAFPYIYIDDGSNHTSYAGAGSTFSTFQKKCDDYIIVKVKNPESHNFYRADKKYNFVDLFLAGEDLSNSVTITRYVNGVAQKMSYDEFVKLVNTGTLESLYEKNKELHDFSQYFNGGPGDTLGSNLAFVSNSMDGITGKITQHQDVNYSKGSDNEAKIIGSMYTAANYYGAVTNILYGNLAAEANAVYAIANAIYKMDGCASVIAEGSLTNGVKNLYNPSGLNSELAQLEKATSELYDTAKSAVLANGRYEELTKILGESTEAGKVGKISISALESAINNVVPALNNEVSQALGLKQGVADFMSGIGSSNILSGGVWDNVKTNMQNYSNLLDANMKSADFISESIKTAMGMVVKYVQNAESAISAVSSTEYGGLVSAGELDDSKLSELQTAITEMETKITEQEATIAKMEAETEEICEEIGTTADGLPNKNCRTEKKYTEEELKPYKEQLEKYKQIKETLNNYKGVLEGLAPVVQAAQEIINQSIDQVKNMYENPVTDSQGNQTFVADFKLDLSPYSSYIDTNTNYKQLIDDYYDKLNPKPVETPADETPADEESGDPDDDYTGGPGGPGGPSTPEVPTDAPTEAPTETPTEIPTEEPTEAPTETPTEKPTETPTEAPTETPTVAPTEAPIVPTEAPVEKPPRRHGGGGSSKKPGTETKPIDPIIVTEPVTEIETVPEEPLIDEYEEEFYSEPEIIEILDPVEEIEKPTPQPKKTPTAKIMGIASGVGLIVGAAALGAHSIIKNKEDDDDYEGYGYDK